ncbi:MAG TPA: hypothetical protein VK468_00245, partial [Pyrinomonadaceae bacterium]|nr:hypothetical protein [Pyrinomonadaceae bacterium]
IVSGMIAALNNYISNNIAKYDDDYTATAFGDNFTTWGTPVILIETGSLHGKDEMFLVKMNFIAILTALRSLADGSEKTISPAAYDMLPGNSSGSLSHIVFRNAGIIDPSRPKATPTSSDIALNFQRRRAEMPAPAVITRVGKLLSVAGLVEYDASDFYVIGRNQPIKPENFGDLLFYRRSRNLDWSAPNLEKTSPPDAIFSVGKWVKGEGSVPQK